MTASDANHQLAGLAAVESVIEIAMRVLVETYRELHRDPPPDDSAETVIAGKLIELCSQLLATIDTHRSHVARRPDTEDHHWPF